MKGVVAHMRASSASGRGAPRTARRPAKVIRIPTATLVRRRQMLRIVVAIGVVVFIAAIAVRVGRYPVRQARPTRLQTQLNPIESRIIDLAIAARTQAGAARWMPT